MATTLIVISPMGETEAPLMGGRPESELCFPKYKVLKGRKRLGPGGLGAVSLLPWSLCDLRKVAQLLWAMVS